LLSQSQVVLLAIPFGTLHDDAYGITVNASTYVYNGSANDNNGSTNDNNGSTNANANNGSTNANASDNGNAATSPTTPSDNSPGHATACD
jgi:hypothetical protein